MLKKLFAAVIAVGLLHTLAFGQGITPNLAKGTTALLFSFNGLSNLNAGDFDGGVGVKYYYKDGVALRLGLQFATASRDLPANPPAGLQGKDGEQSATRFGVSAAAEWHRGTGRANAYLGAGLGFATTSTESKSVALGTANQTVVKNYDNGESIPGAGIFLGGTNFNLFALLGAEFFVFKEVSLAAEYRLGFAKLSRADEEITSGNQTITTKVGGSSGVGISNSGVLTLAFYF
ncbi:MAG: hypothetical protein ALAOOOJD_04016 [bacterium]|nr:hypothetical protein [bacterium]